MNDKYDEMQRDDPLAKLFSNVPVRQRPPADVEAELRTSLHSQWRNEVGTVRRRRLAIVAAAASVAMLAVAIGVQWRGTESHDVAITVASAGTLAGERIYWSIAQSAELQPLSIDHVFKTGQWITTGSESRLALAYAGGSLRLDQNSQVLLSDEKVVELERGRLYVDSRDGALADLVIRSRYGDVRHLGTQYMVELARGVVAVSVREGRVRVDADRAGSVIVEPGERVSVDQAGRVAPTRISLSGTEWHWTEQIASPLAEPEPSIDGFLQWVARETGRTVVYSGGAKSVAETATVVYPASLAPREALAIAMETTSLEYSEDGDTIAVSQARPRN